MVFILVYFHRTEFAFKKKTVFRKITFSDLNHFTCCQELRHIGGSNHIRFLLEVIWFLVSMPHFMIRTIFTSWRSVHLSVRTPV